MIDEIIDLLERLSKGLSSSERESLRAQLLRLMNAQSSSSNLYSPAEVGTDSDKLDGQHGSYYQDAGNINAGTLSTDRYSAYGDLTAESKIGTGATQVAAGDHQNHKVEDLANVVESGELTGDLLQLVDWTEITGGAESLYDSALLTTNGSGNYALAYDKDKTNQWLSTGGPHWTTAAFSHKRFLTKIVITANAGDWIAQDFPQSWNIYGSNTGAFGGEETLMGSGSNTGPAINTTTFAAPHTGYSYYKITFPDNTNLRVNEIEFYIQADDPKWANIVPAGMDTTAIHNNVSGEIATISEKTTPVDADVTIIEDSAATNAKKRLSWANIKATLKTYFDTLYALAANGVTNGDSHDHSGGDGAQINHTTLSNIGTNTHAQIDAHIADSSDPHGSTLTQSGALITPAIKPSADSATALQLQNAAGTSILNIDSTNSRVGIGTTEPVSKLTIEGDYVRFRQAGSTQYRSDWLVNSGKGMLNAYDDTGAVFIPLTISGNPVALMDGNVGIGTTELITFAKLDVRGRIALTSDGNSQLSVDFFDGNLTSNEVGNFFFANANGNYLSDSTAGDMGFRAMGGDFLIGVGSTVASEPPTRLIITTAGNVGIGTTSPAAKLDVAGTLRIDPSTQNETPLLQFGDIFSDYVVAGLLPATSANLTSDISAGQGYVLGKRVYNTATSKTYTASTDTYVDVDYNGNYTFSEVALGAAAPAVAANSIRLAKVVTDADNITSVTDLRPLPGTNGKLDVGWLPVTAARYMTNAGQSIANGTITIVDFEDLVFDTNSAVTIGAAWKFTCPAGKAGYYHVEADITYASVAWEAGNVAQLYLYKNGALYSVLSRKTMEGAITLYNVVHGSDTISLVAGDYIDIRTSQNTGGAVALHTDGLNNHVSIYRI